ncbi:copper resistance CopC family protein [Arthrobacter koreensis]|uniref:copper resistance CopC family protein n=1 Tax=Arthrobacter koreensis TaxID=199136 RepID=UPI002DBA840B|nr:copper resistance CopC family protein [Arthrobacter koreensis]MEB7506048.1 copper resistance protein CopC [Arthrobacter koreensis]
MPTTFYRQARTRASLLAAVLLAAFAAVLFLAAPAHAHDELVSSNPADGAVLDAAPSEIELVFSSELMDLGNQVIVEDAAGNNVAASEPVLTRETLVQAVPALDAGDYKVNWRAVSGDGHPITGTFSFTVNAAGGAQETAAPAATGSATPEATASASPSASEPAPSAEAEPAAEESGTASHLPWALAGAGVGAAAALAAWAITVQVKKRRGTSA